MGHFKMLSQSNRSLSDSVKPLPCFEESHFVDLLAYDPHVSKNFSLQFPCTGYCSNLSTSHQLPYSANRLSRVRKDTLMEQNKSIYTTGRFPDFGKETVILEEILEAFLHPPPPSERESFDKIVEFTIPKATILSIPKRDCENYLFH